MRRLVVFMHTSLDGFVAGPNGEMDWINVGEEIFDYAGERAREADTALYGRVTYEMMQSYWPTAAQQPGASKHDIEHSEWYNRVAKLVVSRSMAGTHPANTTVIGDNLTGEIARIKQGAGRGIVMFGSPTVVHSLAGANLIDDYWLMVNPLLLGAGIPLFGKLAQRVELKLIASHAFSSGVVCLHHASRREA